MKKETTEKEKRDVYERDYIIEKLFRLKSILQWRGGNTKQQSMIIYIQWITNNNNNEEEKRETFSCGICRDDRLWMNKSAWIFDEVLDRRFSDIFY